MDKRAATIAGLIAAVISLLVGMGVLQFLHDSAFGLPRLLATIVLGRGALDPDITSNNTALIVGGAVHLVLGLVFAFLISFTLHRWGFWVGLIGVVAGVVERGASDFVVPATVFDHEPQARLRQARSP